MQNIVDCEAGHDLWCIIEWRGWILWKLNGRSTDKEIVDQVRLTILKAGYRVSVKDEGNSRVVDVRGKKLGISFRRQSKEMRDRESGGKTCQGRSRAWDGHRGSGDEAAYKRSSGVIFVLAWSGKTAKADIKGRLCDSRIIYLMYVIFDRAR